MLILLETMAEESGRVTAPEVLEPLLLRLAKGDQEALGELYHRARASVYGLALSFLKHAHDAEDVTQDTFIRVWENAPRYQPQGTPLAWILAVARNLSLMKLRDRGKTEDMEPEAWERLVTIRPWWKARAQKAQAPKQPRLWMTEKRTSSMAGTPPMAS